MKQKFDVESLEKGYEFLDELPESLFSSVITHPHGTLQEKVKGIMQWRNSLLQGNLPKQKSLSWPLPPIQLEVYSYLQDLNIARFCQKQEELTDLLLQDLLFLLLDYEKSKTEDLPPYFDELRKREEQRQKEKIAREKRKEREKLFNPYLPLNLH